MEPSEKAILNPDNELTRVWRALENFKAEPENLYSRSLQLVKAVEDLRAFFDTGQTQWTFNDRIERFQLAEQQRVIQHLQSYIDNLESQLRHAYKGGTPDACQPPSPHSPGGQR